MAGGTLTFDDEGKTVTLSVRGLTVECPDEDIREYFQRLLDTLVAVSMPEPTSPQVKVLRRARKLIGGELKLDDEPLGIS